MVNNSFVPIRGSGYHASSISFAFHFLSSSSILLFSVYLFGRLWTAFLSALLEAIIWQSGIALHTVLLSSNKVAIRYCLAHSISISHPSYNLISTVRHILPLAIWNCPGYLAPASRPSSLCEVLIRRKCTQYST